MAHYLEKNISAEVGLTSKDIYNLNLNKLDVHLVKRIGNQVHITIVASDEEIQHNIKIAKKADEVKYLAAEGWEGQLFNSTATETKANPVPEYS